MDKIPLEESELHMVVKFLVGYEMHIKLRQDYQIGGTESSCELYIGSVYNDNSSSANITVCDTKLLKVVLNVYSGSEYLWSPMAFINNRKKRAATSTSNDLTLETLVVVDHSLHTKLKAVVPDIEQFVTTLMSIANDFYHHKSLGSRINIAVTKIVIMSEADQRAMGQNMLAQLQLYYFSQWQYQHYPDCDHAVLLTGLSLKGNNYESIVGSAWSGTMCERMFSNSIVEVVSLLSGITIAHEIGHSFDLRHDEDYGTRCSGRSYVMSKQFTLNGELTWSRCSASKLKEFLNSLAQPGQLFDVAAQCKIRHGPTATPCDDINAAAVCSRLWCRVNGRCTTDNFPLVDGTSCGLDRWCRNGKCSEKSSATSSLGKWSAYSDFSACSRSCGGGIQYRQRFCVSPSGDAICNGKNKDFRICNIQSCPSNAKSYRDWHCQMLGFSKAYLNHYYGKHVESTCDLLCSYQFGRLSVVKNVSKVVDGIRCGKSSVCFKGVCSSLGCDGIVNSGAKLDRCGVCNGENESCKVIQQELVTYDYEQVQFPRGARSILITERFRNQNEELRLKNRNGQSVVINPRNQNDSYYFGGTEFFSMFVNGLGRIQANGPIKEDIFLQSRSHLQLMLEYKISRKEFASLSSYGWIAFETKCSAVCGGGSKIRYAKCGTISSNGSRVFVPEYVCGTAVKPKNITLSCNSQPCPTSFDSTFRPQFTFKWRVYVNPCSKSCGSGTQIITYKCFKVETDQMVSDSHCNGVVKPFSYIRRCNTKSCAVQAKWKAGKWSSCSKSCGGGIKYRSIACIDNQSGHIIHPSKCSPHDVPASSSSCNNQKCLIGKWKVHSWAKCKTTNQGCAQTRQLYCYNPQNHEELRFTDCDNSIRPERIRLCQPMACG
ncbi:uncharacterized protein TRIADDRAFT_52613 [Trichoplax adhaerens]|uniref:Peptidase M12B domain-containing protein n=1 Tax=Trichoplax adhaerens TaxID=10228 RepID=B3RJG1_TRIAD|nr:hypothetical protein TRIADDRAFT_52613 [Trichoplax adhaerens]EDV29089.1 hypothetical protein TRIADDRAFT_52613 [Trichoplax adhaerens]|eukprot:XP_002108291.1 hypothetical protein TRIADDRAFT_52613 [Trichoplax adhaerens]